MVTAHWSKRPERCIGKLAPGADYIPREPFRSRNPKTPAVIPGNGVVGMLKVGLTALTGRERYPAISVVVPEAVSGACNVEVRDSDKPAR